MKHLLSCLLFAALGQTVVKAEPRMALLMGAWNYTDPTYPALPRSGIESDLNGMAAKLKALGFDVTLVNNPALRAAKQAVDDFGKKLEAQPGTALFYFSGHGSEYDGRNFLIPVGTDIKENRDLDSEALSADRVLARMEKNKEFANLVFLDCCRNSLSKSGSTGMAAMNPQGVFIGFATSSTKLSNATISGSYYTSALIGQLGTPGLSITDMHTKVTRAVKKMDPTQNPFQYSGLDEIFYFITPDGSGGTAPVSATISKITSTTGVSKCGLATTVFHLELSTTGLKDVPCTLAMFPFIKGEDGKTDYLKNDTDNLYSMKGGYLMFTTKFTPKNERSAFGDLQVEVPHAQLHRPHGSTYTLSAHFEVRRNTDDGKVISVTSKHPATSFTFTRPPATASSIEFLDVTPQYDVSVNGEKGVRLTTSFTVRGQKDKPGRLLAWGYDAATSIAIPCSLAGYQSKSGNLVATTELTPSYDSSTFKSATVFIPYKALPANAPPKVRVDLGFSTPPLPGGTTRINLARVERASITFSFSRPAP